MAQVRIEQACTTCGTISVLNFNEAGDEIKVTGSCCVHLRDTMQAHIKNVVGEDSKELSGFVVKQPKDPSLN